MIDIGDWCDNDAAFFAHQFFRLFIVAAAHFYVEEAYFMLVCDSNQFERKFCYFAWNIELQ